MKHHERLALLGAAIALSIAATALVGGTARADGFRAITPTMTDRTVVLDGRHLTIGEVVDVARDGARVALSPQARQRSADAYGLLLEAAREGVPVDGFDRGAGAERRIRWFAGDPTAPGNQPHIAARELALFQRGAFVGAGPPIADESIVRAMLVVRANTMTAEAASPALIQQLIDLLNDRVTPVVRSRGTVGEGDRSQFMNVAATMVGAGDAYYRGERMPAAEALRRAGLHPLAPFGADDRVLAGSNAYFTGLAALMAYDARDALSWADLTDAIDLDGMNADVAPLALPAQQSRPFQWLNWDAARVLDMLRGSYLFALDGQRTAPDPDSLRASNVRQGAAWQAWTQLRDDLLVAMNSSDLGMTVRVGASPGDSWELETPQLRQYYVVGGPLSHGEHGYVLPSANADPYPLANDVEAFTIALANLDEAVAQRILRFTSTRFTVIPPMPDVPGRADSYGLARASDDDVADLVQDVIAQIGPVPPAGDALGKGVHDLQGQTRIKIERARRAVDDSFELLAEDLLTGTYWLDLRKLQNAHRAFGPAPTAVWNAFRRAVPFKPDAAITLSRPVATVAMQFIRSHPIERFYGAAARKAR